MKKKSITYKFPRKYEFFIKLIHQNILKELKNLVGKNKEVFEPACGYGRIRNYLYKCCKYSGIDLNEYFIEFGEQKGINIKKGNIFDEKMYKKSDVIILSDILHHLKIEDIKKLISISVKYAQEKIIIIEPAFASVASKKNFISKLIAKLFSWLDYDGINHIERWLSKEQYKKLFDEFNKLNEVYNMELKKVKRHYFVELQVQNS